MSSQTSPVFAWQRQPTLSDHAGHLSALFFTTGCNFTCRFCHNAALMSAVQTGIDWQHLDKILASLREHWVDSVTLTGGEPLLHASLPLLIDRIKQHGYQIKLDSNGSFPERLQPLLPQLDYVALDIKTSQACYPQLTGWHQPEQVLRSAELLASSGIDYELRTTIIEEHHDDGVMNALLQEIHGCRRYVLQPFIPRADLPDPSFRTLARTSPQRLQQLAALAAGHAQWIKTL